MRKYVIRISNTAQNDIFEIIDYISEIYKAPLTAEKYLIQLYDAIFSLENFAESIAVSTQNDIIKYGLNARSISSKKLIIVYTVHSRVVLVRAIIPGALINS